MENNMKSLVFGMKIQTIEKAFNMDVMEHLGLDITLKYKSILADCYYNENGEFNEPLLSRVGEIFGLTYEELASGNGKTALRFRKQYSHFFDLHGEYLRVVNEAYKNAPQGSIVVFSFKNISALILGFLELWNNYKKLFIKCLYKELSQEEILEFNFLAHFLEMTDVLLMDRFLTYDVVRRRRELYATEYFKYFWNSICISKRLLKFEAINCLEFTDNKDAIYELNNLNVLWIRDLAEFLIQIENGIQFHISTDNKFDCEIIWGEGYYMYDPKDDLAEENQEKIIEWIEKLKKVEDYYDENNNTGKFDSEIMPNEIGCARMEERKK